MRKSLPVNWTVTESTRVTDNHDAIIRSGVRAYIGLVIPSHDPRYVCVARMSDATLAADGGLQITYTRYKVPPAFYIDDEWVSVVYNTTVKAGSDGAIRASGTSMSARITPCSDLPKDILSALWKSLPDAKETSTYATDPDFRNYIDGIEGSIGLYVISEARAFERFNAASMGGTYDDLLRGNDMSAAEFIDSKLRSTQSPASPWEPWDPDTANARSIAQDDPSALGRLGPGSDGRFSDISQRANKKNVPENWFPVPIAYAPTREELKSMLRPGYTRIGYSSFIMPPGGIVYNRQQAVDMKPLLRATSSLKRGMGMSGKEFQLNFHFEDPLEVNAVLLPLIRQFMKTPFLPIVNSYFNDTLEVDAVALQALQISTEPGFPGQLTATVHMSEFNWNALMPGERGFDSVVCHPLLKLWCETKTPTRAIHGKSAPGSGEKLAFDGAFNWFLPTEDYLRSQEDKRTKIYSDASAAENQSADVMNLTTGLQYLTGNSSQTKGIELAYGIHQASEAPAIRNDGSYSITKDMFVGDIEVVGSTYCKGESLVIRVKDLMFTAELLRSMGQGFGSLQEEEANGVVVYGNVTIRQSGKTTTLRGNIMSRTEMRDLSNKLNSVVATTDAAAVNQAYLEAMSTLSTAYFVIPKQGASNIKHLLDVYEGSAMAHVNSTASAKRGRAAIENKWEQWAFPSMIINQITASTENLLSTMAPQLQESPVHQYMGRADTSFTVSATITQEVDVNSLKHLIDRVEYLSKRFGGLSQYEGYMRVENELFTLLGVENVLPISCKIDTVENFPGTFNVTIQLVHFDPEQKSREELNGLDMHKWYQPSGEFISPGDMMERTSSGYLSHLVRAGALNERLQKIELYPDMSLPTYAEVNKWVELCKKGSSAVKAYYRETTTPIDSWPWEAEDTGLLTYAEQCDVYVDPDFYCVPSYPVGESLVDSILASLLTDGKKFDKKGGGYNSLNLISEVDGTARLRFGRLISEGDLDATAIASGALYDSAASAMTAPPMVDSSPGAYQAYTDNSGVVASGSDKRPQTPTDTITWLRKKGCTREDIGYIISYSRQFGVRVGAVARWFLQEGGIAQTSSGGLASGGMGQMQSSAINAVNKWLTRWSNNTPWGASYVTKDDRFPRPDTSRQRAIWMSIVYMKLCVDDMNRRTKTQRLQPRDRMALGVLAYRCGGGAVSKAIRGSSIASVVSDPVTQLGYADLSRYLSNVLVGMDESDSSYTAALNSLTAGQPLVASHAAAGYGSNHKSVADVGEQSPKTPGSKGPRRLLNVGDKVAGYTVCCAQSTAPIHLGSHANPGVYDIGGRSIKANGKTLEEAAAAVAAEGFVVAIRRMGERGITNDHLHFADPVFNPTEAARLRKQLTSGGTIVDGGSGGGSGIGSLFYEGNLSEKSSAGPNFSKASVINMFYDRTGAGNDMFHDMRHYDTSGRLLQAFPSYCMLLVDGGRWIRFWRMYDKLYGMAAVHSIEVCKSRKTPVDVAVVRLANMYGHLSKTPAEKPWDDYNAASYRANRWTLGYMWNGLKETFGTPSDATTKALARYANSLMLRAGARAHIRMGYGANASKLPIVFNGVISEVTPGDDLLEITALGDGVELTKKLSPTGKTDKEVYKHHSFFGAGTNPREIITAILCPYGLVKAASKGAWKKDNPHGIEHFGAMQFDFPFLANDAECGMNVYAVSQEAILSDELNKDQKTGPVRTALASLQLIAGWGLVDQGASNLLIGIAMEDATPWNVFTTAQMVAPDYILAVHPYEFRSTLFYGKPHWPLRYSYSDDVVSSDEMDASKFTNSAADNFTNWKPYSQIHVVSSTTNLISNNIRASAENMYTQCQAIGSHNGRLGKDDQDNDRSNIMKLDTDIYQEHQKLLYVTTGLYSDSNMKLKDALNNLDPLVSFKCRQALNTYATQALKEAVKDMYEGDVVTLGTPAMKPFDRVFLCDARTQMAGTVEVKEVIHSLSFETGLTTSWQPDLLVSITETADQMGWGWLSQFGARYSAGYGLRSVIGPLEARASVVNGLRALLSFREQVKFMSESGVPWAMTMLHGQADIGLVGIDALLAVYTDTDAGLTPSDRLDLAGSSATRFFNMSSAITPRFSDVVKKVRKLIKVAGADRKYLDPIAKPLSSWQDARDLVRVMAAIGEDLGDSGLVKEAMLAAIKTNENDIARLNIEKQLNKAAALLSWVIPLNLVTVGSMFCGSLSNFVKRAFTARQCLVMRPLRLANKDFVAGIEGHAGCVVGDQPGFWDGVIDGAYYSTSRYGTNGQIWSNGYGGPAALSRGLITCASGLLGMTNIDSFGYEDRSKLYFSDEQMGDMQSVIDGYGEDASFTSAGETSGPLAQTDTSGIVWTKVARGTITCKFGVYMHPIRHVLSMHNGVDIAAPKGTPITAPCAGVVVKSGWSSVLGNNLTIDHGNGVTTVYGHCDRLLVKTSDVVKDGQEIAKMGSTGNSTGPHCHFEKHVNGKPVNPIP